MLSDLSFDYIQSGSGDEYPLSLRVVRFEVADGTFQNVITNLPADEFNSDEIKDLYKLRWNILSASFCFAHLFLQNFDFARDSISAGLKRCA